MSPVEVVDSIARSRRRERVPQVAGACRRARGTVLVDDVHRRGRLESCAVAVVGP